MSSSAAFGLWGDDRSVPIFANSIGARITELLHHQACRFGRSNYGLSAPKVLLDLVVVPCSGLHRRFMFSAR